MWVQNAAYTCIIRALSQLPLRFSAPPPRPRCHPMRVERGLQHPQFSKSPAALGLGLLRLPAMPILRVVCASPNRLYPSGTVHSADPPRAPPRDHGRISAPYPGVLSACRTLFDGVSNAGQRHVGFLTLHLARGGRDGRKLQSAHTSCKVGDFCRFWGLPPTPFSTRLRAERVEKCVRGVPTKPTKGHHTLTERRCAG